MRILKVYIARIPGEIINVGIDSSAGGVDGSVKDLGDGVGALISDAADPDCGVNSVRSVIEEAELHGVGGIENNDDFIEHACVLLRFDVIEHSDLAAVKLKIALILVLSGNIVVGHADRKVAALAADASDYYDRGAVIGREGVLE